MSDIEMLKSNLMELGATISRMKVNLVLLKDHMTEEDRILFENRITEVEAGYEEILVSCLKGGYIQKEDLYEQD